MKYQKLIFFLFILNLSSCHTPTYMFTTAERTGVDFTQGKWLLNQIETSYELKDELTEESISFFQKNLNNRLTFINDTTGLLIAQKINLNPNKTKLKELKDGTGFDFFINIVATKNKSDFSNIELFQDENTSGRNESAVTLEVYDLNLEQIIYSQKVVGIVRNTKSESVWGKQKSDKLIDNITFYKTSNKLAKGSLKKILKDLQKRSITH